MRNLILGIGIGVGVYYLVQKMKKDGQIDICCDQIDKFLSKSKKNLKNVADVVQNEAEYIKERVEDTFVKK